MYYDTITVLVKQRGAMTLRRHEDRKSRNSSQTRKGTGSLLAENSCRACRGDPSRARLTLYGTSSRGALVKIFLSRTGSSSSRVSGPARRQRGIASKRDG